MKKRKTDPNCDSCYGSGTVRHFDGTKVLRVPCHCIKPSDLTPAVEYAIDKQMKKLG